MIKTASEYIDSKDFIDRELDLYDYALSERMVSQEINLFLQDTEFYLDLLAEKLRTLEDLVDYLEFYSEAKIGAAKKLIGEKEQILKGIASKLTEQGSVSVPLSWDINPLVVNTDRNGIELPTAELTSTYCITSSSVLTHEQKPLAMTKESDVQCFSDNLATCIDADYYITEYNLDKPRTIEEYIEIAIGAPENFDFLDYEPINCDVEYIGKNHLNHIVLKLSTSNMYKELENFDYDMYKDSNLNSTHTNSNNHRCCKSVYEHECEAFETADKQASIDYLGNVKEYWLVNDMLGEKKEMEDASK